MKAGTEARKRAYEAQQAARAERTAELRRRMEAAAEAENDPEGFWTVALREAKAEEAQR